MTDFSDFSCERLLVEPAPLAEALRRGRPRRRLEAAYELGRVVPLRAAKQEGDA